MFQELDFPKHALGVFRMMKDTSHSLYGHFAPGFCVARPDYHAVRPPTAVFEPVIVEWELEIDVLHHEVVTAGGIRAERGPRRRARCRKVHVRGVREGVSLASER